jgi:glycerol-3-phosphate acyltransferase PlsY
MLLGMVCLAIVVVDFLRLHVNGIKEAFILFFGSFLRRREIRRLSGASYLLLGCLITSLLYSKPIVVAACSFIIVGDTFAAIFGQNIKSPRIFHNKTILGSIGFLGASIVSACVLYTITPALPLGHLIIGALAASVFEALPLPMDDNFSVPIITGFVISLL